MVKAGAPDRRGDRRARAAARRRATSSSTAATRTSPTPAAARPRCASSGLHFVGSGVSGGEEGALLGPSIMPGGSARVLRDARADPRDDRRAGRRRAVLHARRPGRRRPLRQDGAQRHRVRRHAADRRGLRPAARRARRHRRPRSPRSSASWNEGDLESFLIEITADVLRPRRRRDRQAVRRHRARPGRAEGHRPLDGAERARPRRADHRHRRGHVRPRAVRPRRAARGGPQGVAGAGDDTVRRSATATRSSRTSATRCTPRRSSRTRRASTRSPPAATSTAGTSTAARWRRSGAAAASSGPASSTASREAYDARPARCHLLLVDALLRRRGRATGVDPGAGSSPQAALAGVPTPGVLVVAGVLRRAARASGCPPR